MQLKKGRPLSGVVASYFLQGTRGKHFTRGYFTRTPQKPKLMFVLPFFTFPLKGFLTMPPAKRKTAQPTDDASNELWTVDLYGHLILKSGTSKCKQAGAIESTEFVRSADDLHDAYVFKLADGTTRKLAASTFKGTQSWNKEITVMPQFVEAVGNAEKKDRQKHIEGQHQRKKINAVQGPLDSQIISRGPLSSLIEPPA